MKKPQTFLDLAGLLIALSLLAGAYTGWAAAFVDDNWYLFCGGLASMNSSGTVDLQARKFWS